MPGSGKSTYAADYLGDWTIVSRDQIRMALYGRYTDVDEKIVTVVEQAAIRAALAAGESVMVDATNLNRRFLNPILAIGQENGARIRYRDFPVSLAEAVANDALRTDKRVGRSVIEGFFSRYRIDRVTGELPARIAEPAVREPYVLDTNLSDAFLVDTDGTVALMDGRGPYDTSRYAEDRPNDPVIQVVRALASRGHNIIGLSGRSDEFRDVTEAWWDEHVKVDTELFLMRAAGDQRNDAVVKYELFDQHVRNNFAVLGVFDDRPRVLRMWRGINIPTFQIGNGAEF